MCGNYKETMAGEQARRGKGKSTFIIKPTHYEGKL